MIRSSWEWLFLALVVFIINQLLRAFRFSILIHSKEVMVRDIFSVQCLYSLFAYLLPFRSGEPSYIYILKKYVKIPATEGVATLLVARIFDYIAISFLFFFVLFLVWGRLPLQPRILIFPVVMVLFIIFLFFVFLIFRGGMVVGFLKSINGGVAPRYKRLTGVILRNSEEILTSLRKITNKNVYMTVFLISMLTWLVLALSFDLMIRALGYDVSYLTALCLTVLLFPVAFAQGVGNLGTHEAEWVPILLLFGFHQETAISIALSSHAIIFSYILLMAGYAKLTMIKKPLWIRR